MTVDVEPEDTTHDSSTLRATRSAPRACGTSRASAPEGRHVRSLLFTRFSMAPMELSRPDVEHPLTDFRAIERWPSLAAATVVLAYGFSRRSVPGVAIAAAAATPFAYRTLAGKWPFENGDTRSALAGTRGIHVREAVRVERPVSEVYAFWRQLENLP